MECAALAELGGAEIVRGVSGLGFIETVALHYWTQKKVDCLLACAAEAAA